MKGFETFIFQMIGGDQVLAEEPCPAMKGFETRIKLGIRIPRFPEEPCPAMKGFETSLSHPKTA